MAKEKNLELAERIKALREKLAKVNDFNKIIKNMKKCPYCAEEIQEEAIKCKHCGSQLTSLPEKSNVVSTQVNSNKTTSATPAVGIVLIIIGFILIGNAGDTGILIGIGIMIVGILTTAWALAMGIVGKCPYCESDIVCSSISQGVTCKACNNRVVIKEKRFMRVK